MELSEYDVALVEDWEAGWAAAAFFAVAVEHAEIAE